MNKLMTVVAASVCAVSLSGSAVAAEVSSTEKSTPDGQAAAEAQEEEEPAAFEAGFDFDYFSAYVWRNAIQNDRQVMQPCVWADFTQLDPFWFGFSVWQNYDLTDRRRDVYKHAQNETDFNLHAGVTAWQSDDEEMGLDVEFGHDWYTYQGVRSEEKGGYCDTRELYLKATFNNPIVGVYGQASWMYDDFGDYSSGFYYEVGFNKEVELSDTLTLGADWNVGFGDRDYLSFLFGDVHCVYDDNDELVESDRPYGFGGTTVKVYLNWAITDWMTLGGTVAFTSVLNGPVRDELDNGDWWSDGDKYERDFVWGGVSLKLAF